jgi:lipopolysaccharide transport system ATP-binding protein
MSVLTVQNVWKQFKIPHEKRASVFHTIGNALSLLEGKRYTYEEFWALKEISFSLEHGESLGIIGLNGSGKSTLLKLIAGVMRPDKGTLNANGTIAPILELGIGFHGELSVKENALVYGVIMGLPRSGMKESIESILDFAGLRRFQDAKLKTLSSGMGVRLAFSIAVQTEADIFLVDEALAVGDMDFQEKCLDKFREFKKQRKSIVLVSHSMDLVKGFCEKTLYLQEGAMRAFGPSEESINRYLQDDKLPSDPHLQA